MAKEKGRSRSTTLEFWFRRKFNLAPTDPRFLAITEEELVIEYWTWVFAENPNFRGDEDDDFDQDEILRKMANGEEWVEA